jgi:hypothetical protein
MQRMRLSISKFKKITNITLDGVCNFFIGK